MDPEAPVLRRRQPGGSWRAAGTLAELELDTVDVVTGRLEKGYRAWGRDIGPDRTPLEAGLAFAVRLDKPFTGREALVRQREQGLTQRLVQFVLADPEPLLFGGELILRDGQSVGEVTSAAYGHTLGRAVALGWVRDAGGVDKATIEAGTYELDVGGERFAATAHLESPYDPKGARIRA